MLPADRVSTHDLPLAESLSAVVNREKYHIIITFTTYYHYIFYLLSLLLQLVTILV